MKNAIGIGLLALLMTLPGIAQRVAGGSNATAIQGTPVASTVPTSGQVLSYSGSDKQWEPGSGGGGTTIVKSAQYATADQLSEAGTFATTYTIPAGTLKAGSLIEIWTAGPYNITTGERLQPGITIGGVAALPTSGQFLSSGTGNWNLDARCAVVTAGSGGTAECEGVVSASGAVANAAVPADTTFAVNTTSALTVAIPAAGLISADGTANLSQLIVVVVP